MDILVEKLMSDKIVSVKAENNVQDLAEEMTRENVGSLLVTKGEEYVGIVTEVDIVRKVVGKGINPKAVMAESIMASPIVTVESSQSVMEANDLMEKNHIRHLAVTREGEIVGILSVRDLLHPVYVG